MCGYSNLATFKDNITGDVVYEQFRRGFEIIKKIPHHEMVAIGTAGSFLDPHEVPYEIQAKIIKELNSSGDIYYINIEIRAEYVTKESLENLVEVVDDPHKLAIGIGLESSNELIRELCVNKCLPIASFIRAKRLPEELRKNVLIATPRLPKPLELKVSDGAQTAIELLNEYKGTLDYNYIDAIDALSSSDKRKWYENLEREMNNSDSIEKPISTNFSRWLEAWKNEHGRIFQ